MANSNWKKKQCDSDDYADDDDDEEKYKSRWNLFSTFNEIALNTVCDKYINSSTNPKQTPNRNETEILLLNISIWIFNENVLVYAALNRRGIVFFVLSCFVNER